MYISVEFYGSLSNILPLTKIVYTAGTLMAMSTSQAMELMAENRWEVARTDMSQSHFEFIKKQSDHVSNDH